MNGRQKFHKANGPAFATGEVWYGNGGRSKVVITNVRKFGDDKWDYDVTYLQSDGTTHSKDAWNFQVRYTHAADITMGKVNV